MWDKVYQLNLNKTSFRDLVGISNDTLAKLSKNENVSMGILEKICIELNCNVSDIIEFIKVPLEKEGHHV
ncbi:helix-turn-helix domain-containing protein [Loigolactobacillus coryniformis]|nr:helix-turn-helix transcriptional regulator [Loigolactobacillus coryniformis]